jgi:hypothetical protein
MLHNNVLVPIVWLQNLSDLWGSWWVNNRIAKLDLRFYKRKNQCIAAPVTTLTQLVITHCGDCS